MTIGGWLQSLVNNNYTLASLVVIISIILAVIVLFLLKKYIEVYVIKNKFEEKVLLKIESPLAAIIVLFGLQIAFTKIIASSAVLINITSTLMIVFVTYVASEISHIVLHLWSHRMSNRKSMLFHEEILPLAQSITEIILFIIGLLLILTVWSVNIFPILASLGIAGVILGFALKESLENMICGISMIFDNDFKRGDLIKLESGEKGQIMEITLRSTTIMTLDNVTLIVPNAMIARTRIINYAKPTNDVRIEIDVNVGYGSDDKKVRKVLLDSTKGVEGLSKGGDYQPIVVLCELGDFALKYRLYAWVDDYTKMYPVKDKIITKVYNEFRRHKIEIPFPTRIVYNRKSRK